MLTPLVCLINALRQVIWRIVVLTVFTACGGKIVEEEPGNGESSHCSLEVGAKPIQHACSHTTNGPFENVVATHAADAPNVDAIHVSYLVDSSLAQDTFVAFVARRDGEHLIVLDREAPLQVTNEGEALTPQFAGAVDGCSSAQYGEVYVFSRNQNYLIEVPRDSRAPTLLFFEHLSTFGKNAWEEGCPDEEPR